MNEAKINEAISAWFEPKPTWRGEIEYDLSPLCYWIWNGREWEPRDNFLHSEDANAKLLEAMAVGDDGIRLEMWLGPDNVLNVWIQDRSVSTPTLYVKANDRKTTIVLAFCKFAGIEI